MSDSLAKSLYERRSGALSFKGRGSLKDEKKKERKRKHKKREREGDEDRNEEGQEEVEVEEVEGEGRIVSSGDTIQGFETKFLDQCETGDVLMIKHPLTHQVEKRIISKVMTNRSMTVSDGFSTDLVSTTSFAIRKEGAILRKKAEKAASRDKKRQKGDADEDFDKVIQDEVSRRLQKNLKKAAKIVTVREKTGMWGYKVVSRKADHELTAEERLDERCKQGRDKFCW
ncbi:hypothetical protein BESB_006380 [Besnoitia besnoiti]|uniref:Uncharacterized protein n=1 Tax=Besnoitia besnoiti TaxID=94643 RepID=A0A2A9MQ63_BESBE|nr:hypothetical protein BESB_006380 [Besnoitia besnoiti]PFH38297.1 hypothetical protein BESB_006380 [Besnoitia besnoiti]